MQKLKTEGQTFDRFFRMFKDIARGVDYNCPICNHALGNSQAGINSHFHKHIRNKEMTAEESLQIRIAIGNRLKRNKEK